MENTLTFKQTGNQTAVVLVILGATVVIMGSIFLGFYLFGADSSESFVFIVSSIVLVFIGIFVFVRKYMLKTYTMIVGQEGFSVTDHQTQNETRYVWSAVARYKAGVYDANGIKKEYLWIWMKDGKLKYFIEDDGTDQDRTRTFEEFRSLSKVYLAKELG